MSKSDPVAPSRIPIRVLVAALAAALPGAGLRAQDAPAAFRDGDRWIAVGDSMNRGGSFRDLVELFYLTRFPDRTLQAHNCGLGEDTAEGVLRRVDWDVLGRRPTVCTILLGVNDVARPLLRDGLTGAELERLRRDSVEAFSENLKEVVARLQASGVRVILMTSPVLGDAASEARPRPPTVSAALADVASSVAGLARETGSGWVDFRGRMEVLSRESGARDLSALWTDPDRLHPSSAGHLVMAYELLRAQGMPSLVSRLAIDLRSNQILAADNGVVEGVRKQTDGGLLFTWTERALPFPVEPEAVVALDWISFVRDLNQQILQIDGLRSGRYELRIDDTLIDTFTAEQYAAGINLATFPETPQLLQAQDVHRLLKARSELVADNIRRMIEIEEMLAPTLPRPVTLAQMEPLIAERLETMRTEGGDPRVIRAIEHYPQRKEREAEAIASADRLARLAYLTAQPRPHVFLLRRTR